MEVGVFVLAVLFVLQSFVNAALKRRIVALEKRVELHQSVLSEVNSALATLTALHKNLRLAIHKLANIVHEGQEPTFTDKDTLN